MLKMKYLLLSTIFKALTINADNQHAPAFKQNDYKVAFERAELASYNDRYVDHFSLVTFKYNRTWPVVNATFGYKINIGHEMHIVIQAYKFMSNEYRPFPIHFQVNYCEAVEKNYIGVAGFTRCGNYTGCPMAKGRNYHICNWSLDQAKFPPYIPNGQYMLELQALYLSSDLFLIRGYGVVTRPIV